MDKEEMKVLLQGKYACLRKKALTEQAPGLYASMEADGTLDEHLAHVQQRVDEYIDMCVTRYKMSEEYIDANKADPLRALRYVNMTVKEAEDAAMREWVYNIPDDDKEDDEDE